MNTEKTSIVGLLGFLHSDSRGQFEPGPAGDLAWLLDSVALVAAGVALGEAGGCVGVSERDSVDAARVCCALLDLGVCVSASVETARAVRAIAGESMI